MEKYLKIAVTHLNLLIQTFMIKDQACKLKEFEGNLLFPWIDLEVLWLDLFDGGMFTVNWTWVECMKADIEAGSWWCWGMWIRQSSVIGWPSKPTSRSTSSILPIPLRRASKRKTTLKSPPLSPSPPPVLALAPNDRRPWSLRRPWPWCPHSMPPMAPDGLDGPGTYCSPSPCLVSVLAPDGQHPPWPRLPRPRCPYPMPLALDASRGPSTYSFPSPSPTLAPALDNPPALHGTNLLPPSLSPPRPAQSGFDSGWPN